MSDVSVFVSYAHIDDQATHGRIEEIANDSGRTYSTLTGKTAVVFFDKDSIALGEKWKERIRSGLSSATILLAFVSPSYMKSSSCRAELREFLSFLGQGASGRLIIPLLLVDRPKMDELFSGDELWVAVKEIQNLVIQDMKFDDPGTGSWLRTIHKIAERVDQKLAEQAEKGSAIDPGGDDSGDLKEATSVVGKLEVIARIEQEGPELGVVAQEYGSLIEKFGAEMEVASPKVASSNSFAQRLTVANNLAKNLTPIADGALAASGKMVRIVTSMNEGVILVIRMAKIAPDRDTVDVQNFLGVIEMTANSLIDAASKLGVFEETIKGLKGYSSELDQPLEKMQESLLLTSEIRAIGHGWLDELKDLES